MSGEEMKKLADLRINALVVSDVELNFAMVNCMTTKSAFI
jgi:hypothetical protein